MLGEWQDPAGGYFDIQLKGAGPTPYSRGGDGRSPVGPVVREYLVSEAMHALGVPSSRALAAIYSGEKVYREYPEPGAVLTRVASSHLRIGTIQYFAMTQGGEGLSELVPYVVNRHYENASAMPNDVPVDRAASPASVLLSAYAPRLASLVAHWQVLGFVHGVMNTDNMLLSGETIDYGPCALMDHFDPNALFSSIDTQGRYAWPNQPPIAHWNFSVLAQCLLPLLSHDKTAALATAQQAVDAWPQQYQRAYDRLIAGKFGLDRVREGDRGLVDGFYQILAEHRLDLTLSFRWLTELATGAMTHSPLPELFTAPEALTDWCSLWIARRSQNEGDLSAIDQQLTTANPCVIPRNHQVAQAITEAEAGSLTLFHTLHERWSSPNEWQRQDLTLARPPEDTERVTRTFCGT